MLVCGATVHAMFHHTLKTARRLEDSMIAPRILILSSEVQGLEFLRCMVEHTVLDGKIKTTTSTEEALKEIQRNKYHVVLCDMDLYEASGAVFLEEALCIWPRPTIIPIVRGEATLSRAYDHVAFSCLRKPLAYDALSAVLHRAIEFNLLHRRVERYSQVLRLMNDGTGVYADQLRSRIVKTETAMRELWEGEREERERGALMELESSPEDCDAVLRDPSFGWAVETLLIHTADKSRRKVRKTSKVA